MNALLHRVRGGSEERRTKGYRLGTHRLIEPQATLEQIRPRLPEMGITRIANVTGLDRIGLPVVMVTRPNSRSLSVAQGKGLDLVNAMVSGVMESVESYHAERIELPIVSADFATMTRRCSRVSVAEISRCKNSPFHPHHEVLWIRGENLFDGEMTWIPYESVHTDYTLPAPVGSGCFAATSNGLASGNHPLEAIIHGISEVIERDAVTLFSLQSDQTREHKRLDLSTVSDADCLEIINKFRSVGSYVNVWDTTSDIGVPVFLCHLTGVLDPTTDALKTSVGSGCHPSREIALLRALTEAAQSRLTHITGSRDDMPASNYRPGVGLRSMTIRPRILLDEQLSSYKDVPSLDSNSLDDDLEWLLERLGNAGFSEVIAVDLTLPQFSIPVFRIVIPGLEAAHDTADYVPGNRARAIASL